MKSKKDVMQNILWSAVIVLISLACIFIFSRATNSLTLWKNSVSILSEKREDISTLSIASAASATAVATFPGDATTPIANELANITSYLIILDGIILFEEILVTYIPFFSIKYLVPIVLVMLGIYLWTKKAWFKEIAIKCCIFVIAINLVIPFSTELMARTDRVLDFEESLEAASNFSTELDEDVENEEETGIGDKLKAIGSTVVESITNKVTDTVRWSEDKLKSIENAVTSLVITAFIIPIFMLFLFGKIVQIFWSIKLKHED